MEQPKKAVKESARSAGKKTIKTVGKGSAKTAQKTVKTAERTAKTTVKTAQRTAKAAQKTAQATVKASQRAVQAARAAARAAVVTAKAIAKAIALAVKAIIAGTKALIAAIAAGGWIAVLVIIVICLIGMLLGSVFGIFFSGEDSGTGMSMQTVVQEINTEYDTKLQDEKNSVSYDVLEMNGSRAVWKEVLAVYSVKVNTDPDNPQEVATMDESKKQLLTDIFWEMNEISSSTDTKTETVITETDDGHGNIVETESTVTQTYLYITVSHKTADEMAAQYGFNEEQKEYGLYLWRMMMKHFRVYRKLILIAGTVIAAISAGAVLFMESTSALMFLIICAFAILCGLLFLLDFLHNRYHDDLLEQITLLIEALVEQQERIVFPENEDTLTARLQHQLLKLRNILTAQNQMLAQEKEQIKTLISDISHQIKTPVAAANTFAQLLDDKELSDEERSEYIATLQTSLEKLTFLTNSLIKMSRLESGIISLKPEKNSLNDIVLQAVKTVYAKAKEKNITITFDCERQFEALLDYNWTAEAITNVLDNAVKYTPSGGIVGLEITEYPSYLRLDISDNGIGIPEEEQAKIFGRFYRGKQSAGIDGVGIGLYLTRDIINKQKGYIKVASDENGSIFSLFLKKD